MFGRLAILLAHAVIASGHLPLVMPLFGRQHVDVQSGGQRMGSVRAQMEYSERIIIDKMEDSQFFWTDEVIARDLSIEIHRWDSLHQLENNPYLI